ncbi:helix-turn-helix domain-containing protein [Ruegeria atlantica]
MKPEQLRMARNALGLSMKGFADLSRVSHMTVHRFEAGKSGVKHAMIEAMRTTLEAEGVQFLNYGSVSDGIGVAIKPNPTKTIGPV